MASVSVLGLCGWILGWIWLAGPSEQCCVAAAAACRRRGCLRNTRWLPAPILPAEAQPHAGARDRPRHTSTGAEQQDRWHACTVVRKAAGSGTRRWLPSNEKTLAPATLLQLPFAFHAGRLLRLRREGGCGG